jgi:transposase
MKNVYTENDIKVYKNRISELELLVKHYEEKFRLFQKKKYGASSEKSLYNQLTIDGNDKSDEALVGNPELEKELPFKDIKEHYRKKRTRKESLPQNLPVEEIVCDLEEKECPNCGTQTEALGNDYREELVIIPARVEIRKFVIPKYICRKCGDDAEGESTVIISGSAPNPVIKGSHASPESIAYAAYQKFVMGVPLYRQEQEWQRKGVLMSRQTLANQLIVSSEKWLAPLWGEMKNQLLARDNIHADETTLQVLREEHKKPQSDSWLWCYRTSGHTDNPLVVAEYRPNRKDKNPATFLSTFKGYLHTDGWPAYHKLSSDIVVVGCWAHARRKWDEALKAMPPNARNNNTLELKGKQYCDKMFEVEKHIAKLPQKEKYKKRQEALKPIMDEFFAWAFDIYTNAKSSLGRAIGYMRSQEKYLRNVLLDGRLELSNNRAERTIKTFVISRKNFLFANTVRGANTAATIFSLVETAKETGVDPFEYLCYVFKTAPNVNMTNPENLQCLLPFGFKYYPVLL